jgi:hypothetical protein
MRNRIVALALVVFIPLSVAHAQRGGRGAGGGGGGVQRGGAQRGGGRGGRGNEAARFPSASELKRYNPADLLVSEKKKLSLSEMQIASLTTLKQTITDRNAAFLAHYDTLEKAYKPDPVPPPYGRDKDELNQAKVLRAMIDTLQVRRILDVADAIAVVTDDNARHLAAQFLMKQETEFRSRLPQPPPRDYLAPPGGR